LRPEKARLDDASLTAEKSALINELATAFARRLEFDDLLPFVFESCRELLGAAGVSLLLYDQEHHQFYFPYVSERDPEARRKLADLRVPADHGIAGAVFQSRRAELIADVAADPRHYAAADEKTGTATGSMLAVPLISADKGLGVIEAVRRRGQSPFSESDLSTFEELAGSIAIAVENAAHFSRVKDSADRLLAEVGSLRRALARTDRFSEMIGTSPAMSEVFTLMEGAAVSGINVLIEGETGTGKELVARGIHRTSTRADAPFLALNCAAVPEGLLESELFGSRRGAYTGATDDRAGLFKAANGGVLFLDEIGDMPMAMQAKLLRVIQEGEVTPLGETRSQKVSVRVFAATNSDLEAAVTARTFRSDLYYRLAGFTIRVPPLRDRREDIPLMAARFLEIAAQRNHKRIDGFRLDAMEALTNAHWPGNVRQLINAIERAVAMAREGESISIRHLSREVFEAPPEQSASSYQPGSQRNELKDSSNPVADTPRDPATAGDLKLENAVAAFEAKFLSEALARHKGNVSHTAISLGISRVTLQKKMKEYRLR
jgi:transcriptional regulator with GAF, ATPase, and Fis domain